MSSKKSSDLSHTIPSSKPSPFLYVTIATGVVLLLGACVYILFCLRSYNHRRLVRRWCSLALLTRRARIPTVAGDFQPKRKSINSRGYWDYTECGENQQRETHDLEWNSAGSIVPSNHVRSTDTQSSWAHWRAFTDHQPKDVKLQPQQRRQLSFQQDTPPSPPISPLSTSKSCATSSISSLDISASPTSNDHRDRVSTIQSSSKEYWTTAFTDAAKTVFSAASPHLHPSRKLTQKQTLSIACAGTDQSDVQLSSDHVRASPPYIEAPQPVLMSVRGLASNMTYMGSSATYSYSQDQADQRLKSLPFPRDTGFGNTRQKIAAPVFKKKKETQKSRHVSSNLLVQQPRRISAPVTTIDLALRLQKSYKLTNRDLLTKSIATALPAIPKLSLSPIAPITPGNGTPKLENFVDESDECERWRLPAPLPAQHISRFMTSSAVSEKVGRFETPAHVKKQKVQSEDGSVADVGSTNKY